MSVSNTFKKPISYEIRDAKGQLIALHHRRVTEDGKRMWWTLPDGSKGLNGTPLAELPLYGSEHVADLHEDDLVVLVEGEKARVRSVRSTSLAACTCQRGSVKALNSFTRLHAIRMPSSV